MHTGDTKLFDEWNEQKQRLEKNRVTRRIKRRDIWWADLGVNIGHEQDGGGPLFERPVVILKTFGNKTCLIAPLTGMPGDAPFYFDLEKYGYRSRVLITQLRLVSTKRLSRSIERLDTDTFAALLEIIKTMNGFC